MVVALAVKGMFVQMIPYVTHGFSGKTASMGATTLNTSVPLMQFWTEQIEPEILTVTDGDVNRTPLLKADALKFLNTFRSKSASILDTCMSRQTSQDAYS